MTEEEYFGQFSGDTIKDDKYYWTVCSTCNGWGQLLNLNIGLETCPMCEGEGGWALIQDEW